MAESKLQIEYLPIDELKPYEKNAKLHPVEQIEQIKRSIRDYGFRDPVGVWHGEIVEGHGRVIAARELGMTEIPVIRLDELTDEQRREYALVHNQTTMNSGFDFFILDGELEGLPNFDAEFYGFDDDFSSSDFIQRMLEENPIKGESKSVGEYVFSISFAFPKEKRDIIEPYIKENKDKITIRIIEEAERNA